MNYDDGKENFRVELPTRVMKSVRFNPMHAKLVAVEMISEYGSPITIKRNHNGEWLTEMIAVYENDRVRFFMEDKG